MERWQLAAGHLPTGWLIAAILLCAGVALGEAWLSFRDSATALGRRRAFSMLSLRTLAIAGLCAVAFELTLHVDDVTSLGSRVVVLFDRSASLSIPDGLPRAARYERALAQWKGMDRWRDGWTQEGITLEVRTFDRQSAPISGDVTETLAQVPTAPASELAQALEELKAPGSAPLAPLRAVVVVSDGLVAPDAAAERRLDAAALALGVPITTIAVGASPLQDISVARVRAGEFAFVENVTEIDATVVSFGYAGTPVEVELRRDGETIERRQVVLGESGEATEVHFEVAPDRVGQFVYEVAIAEQPGEATGENNRRPFVVKVLRDKVRVLHVAGRPDWDVRALRTLLRRDPNVELLSYYILRGMDDISREDTSAPLSLIPFPTDDLFQEELGSFDVVILHNFDAVQHQVGQYVDNMAAYVEDGGALVLIGGDLAFSDQGYGAPAMAAIMPVDTRAQLGAEPEPFRPALTDAGRRHPITAWLGTAADGWSELPELDQWNPLRLSAHADAIGAAALLEHPSARDRQGHRHPILAVAEPGEGRVVVLGSSSTWRLGFATNLPLIDGARPYDLLWLGAIRWLLRDDSSGRLQLETDRPRYEVGERTTLQAITLSPSYAPEEGVEIAWTLVPLGNGPDAEPIRAGTWRSDAQGTATETLAPLPAGAYAAVAQRGTDADTATQVRRVFVVETPGRELADLNAEPGGARMERLAQATGGLALDGSSTGGPREIPLAELSDDLTERIDGRRETPVWSHALTLLLVLLSLGGEWILRRQGGAA